MTSCAHDETLHYWLSEMHSVKILNRYTNAQADLSLRLAPMAESMFSDVEAQRVK